MPQSPGSTTQAGGLAGAPPMAPALGAAVSRAFEARRIYGDAHDASRRALEHLSSITRGLTHPVVLHVGRGGISHNGEALEPASDYQRLADALMALDAGAIEFTGPLDKNSAVRVLDLIAGGRDVSTRNLEDNIARASGGAVRIHRVSADTLRMGRAPDREPAAQTPMTIADTVGRQDRDADASGQSLRTVIDSLSARPERDDPARAATPRSDTDPTWLDAALGSMAPSDQNMLMQALASQDTIPYASALEALARMPAVNVASAIAVIGRADARLSETSLLMLRRYANLAVASPSELARLAEVAEAWKDDERGGELAVASAAASGLLRRLSDTEYRSEEYSRLLRDLVDLRPGTPTALKRDVEDDASSCGMRSVEILCDLLADRDAPTSDRAAVLDALSPRVLSLAEAGSIDVLGATLVAACELATCSPSPEEREAIGRFLLRAREEQWVALAVARCCNAEAACACVMEWGKDADARAALVVQAAGHARSPAERSGVLGCAANLDASRIRSAFDRACEGAPLDAARGSFLMIAASPADPVGALRALVVSTDAKVRQQVLLALGEAGAPWPLDLCIRAIFEDDPPTRMLGLERLADAHPHRVDLLLARLSRELGPLHAPDDERALLVRLIRKNVSGSTTRRVCVQAVKGALSPASRDDRVTIEDLVRERPRSLGTRLTLALCAARQRFDRRAA